MLRKLFQLTKKHLERILLIGALVITVVATLWMLDSRKHADSGDKEEGEVGLVIPKGFLVMPLEMINASALSGLVDKTAHVDLFKPGEAKPFVENLRIFRLNAGEGPVFGALVPRAFSGSVTTWFAKPLLIGTLRKDSGSATKMRPLHLAQPMLSTVTIEEESP